ncbi:hypothetical protein [Paludisphaera rhizosphaerae]|uniref:hypothetical protein n=1 Tax=Paludisphaera rhizosphaerae TaxID=2711216 RepID=UPI0013EAB96C|nr:hypothetical protein [Paludisphaera rhizosphaerae]
MSYYPDLYQSLAYTGGLAATTGALVAQAVSSDPAVGAGSFLLGGAGLIAAVSAFTKDFWQDRQKQREHELARLKIRAKNDQADAALAAVLAWIRAAHQADAGLPPAPDVGPIPDHRNDE